MEFKITTCIVCQSLIRGQLIQFPTEARNCSVFYTNPGRKCGPFNPNSLGTLARPSAVRRKGREADHSLPPSAKVGNRWSCTSTSPHAFMECKTQLQVLWSHSWLAVPYSWLAVPYTRLAVPYSVALNLTPYSVTFKNLPRYFCAKFQIIFVSVSLYCNSFSQVVLFAWRSSLDLF
jgi:hypothetical protein